MLHFRHSQPALPRRQCRRGRSLFTMIEMLVVMIIVSILVAMLLPSFERMALGSGVNGAARAVSAQLRMTRQYAIANRERVALLMPAGEADDHDKRWSAYRACIVDNNNNWVDWVPNTEWQYLPAGAVIAQINNTKTLHDEPNDDTTMISGVNGEPPIRAIVFTPTGRLVAGAGGGNRRKIFIVEGAVADGSRVIRNPDNYRILDIDTFTGRTTYDNERLTDDD